MFVLFKSVKVHTTSPFVHKAVSNSFLDTRPISRPIIGCVQSLLTLYVNCTWSGLVFYVKNSITLLVTVLKSYHCMLMRSIFVLDLTRSDCMFRRCQARAWLRIKRKKDKENREKEIETLSLLLFPLLLWAARPMHHCFRCCCLPYRRSVAAAVVGEGNQDLLLVGCRRCCRWWGQPRHERERER